MRKTLIFSSLVVIAIFYSCKNTSQKTDDLKPDNPEVNLEEIDMSNSTWQDSTLGPTTIKSLIETGFYIEPNIYKLSFNTYRKFKKDSISLRVISSIDKIGQGKVDSIIFRYDNEKYEFKYLNYIFFSPKTLVNIYENKGINIKFDDFNFDNYPDIRIYNSEASGVKNIIEDIYVYDLKKQRYYRNKILSNNSNISIDTVSHTLSAFAQGGMASMIYGSTTYKWNDSKLVKIKTVNQIYNDSLQLFIREVRTLKDTIWVSTIDSLIEENAREWK